MGLLCVELVHIYSKTGASDASYMYAYGQVEDLLI